MAGTWTDDMNHLRRKLRPAKEEGLLPEVAPKYSQANREMSIFVHPVQERALDRESIAQHNRSDGQHINQTSNVVIIQMSTITTYGTGNAIFIFDVLTIIRKQYVSVIADYSGTRTDQLTWGILHRDPSLIPWYPFDVTNPGFCPGLSVPQQSGSTPSARSGCDTPPPHLHLRSFKAPPQISPRDPTLTPRPAEVTQKDSSIRK
ncbi:hypothetical protein EDD17DRAFT_1506450 [Pisolithus thermaeus]|nr:hypothetical protein EV401DRAFT_1887617 [Pisolithus croceorrhizus]KAI6164442.1 hypothetical protein EDD17DRAFT_1506450 [Pisolithus thermaeus]